MSDELRYKNFSIVFIQIFAVENNANTPLQCHFPPIDNSIDNQIFLTDPLHPSPVRRYRLPGFDFHLSLNNPYEIHLEGHIYAEASVFFNRTISVTYRMVVDQEICRCDREITTDHLISLASLNMGAEHWSCDDDKKFSTINLDISHICIDRFYIDENGKPSPTPLTLPAGDNHFGEIQRRYKTMLTQGFSCWSVRDMNYVYIDIWENVGHTDHLFETLTEPEIITHIYRKHVKELVGLMSLYPYEWPYRTDESFEDVCGSNIAIDTDDLILVNPNICVVFGTYGLRGKDSPTDWIAHLKERKQYHVSWPEYLLILEMVLAKKYTITGMLDMLFYNTLHISSLKGTRSTIEDNARQGLEITKLSLQLDAVKYSRYVSHKIMFERTALRLEIGKDAEQLNETVKRIDKSLVNISEMRKLKQSSLLNLILGSISAASLFGILFQRIEIPFLTAIGLNDLAGNVGIFIIGFTLFLIVICVISMIIFSFKNNKF